MDSLRRRIFNGLGANSFGQIVNAVIQIASLPLFVYYWGTTIYGEWLVLSTIPAYLAMSEMGFSSVAGTQMSMEVAAGNKTSALKTYQSTGVLLIVACVIVLALGLLATHLPLSTWLNLSSFTTPQLQLIMVLLSFTVAINLQTGLLSAAFRCEGHYALSTWLNNFNRLVEFGAIAISLHLGALPETIAGISLLMRCLGYILTLSILKKKLKWLRHGWSNADFSTVKSMARPALAFMAFPLSNAVKSQGMLTIVGITLGPAMVIAFSSMRTLINMVQQAMGMINSVVWPEISAAYGAGNLPLARQLHRNACRASFWMACVSMLLLFFLGPWILQHWTIGSVSFDRRFFSLMMLAMVFNSFWFTSSVVQAATNTHLKIAALYLITSTTALVIAYVITPNFGLNGPAFGLLVMEVFMASYVLPASLAKVQDQGLSFLRFLLNLK